MSKSSYREFLTSASRAFPPGHPGWVLANGFSGGGGGGIAYGTRGGAGGGGVAQYEQNAVQVLPIVTTVITVGSGGSGDGSFAGGGQFGESWDGENSRYGSWNIQSRFNGDTVYGTGGGGGGNGGNSHTAVAGAGDAINPNNGGGGVAGLAAGGSSTAGASGNSTTYYGGGAGGARDTNVLSIYGAGGGGGGGVRGPGGAGADAKRNGQSQAGTSAAANSGAGGGGGTQAPGGNGGSGYMSNADWLQNTATQTFSGSVGTFTASPGYKGPVLLTAVDSAGLTTTMIQLVNPLQSYSVNPGAGTFNGDVVGVPTKFNNTITMDTMRVTWWPNIACVQSFTGSGTWTAPPGMTGAVLLYGSSSLCTFNNDANLGVATYPFGPTGPYPNQPATFNQGVIPYPVTARQTYNLTVAASGTLHVVFFP